VSQEHTAAGWVRGQGQTCTGLEQWSDFHSRCCCCQCTSRHGPKQFPNMENEHTTHA